MQTDTPTHQETFRDSNWEILKVQWQLASHAELCFTAKYTHDKLWTIFLPHEVEWPSLEVFFVRQNQTESMFTRV